MVNPFRLLEKSDVSSWVLKCSWLALRPAAKTINNYIFISIYDYASFIVFDDHPYQNPYIIIIYDHQKLFTAGSSFCRPAAR
jgi:hypothetical protein